jgi:hypothetical protein
LCHDSPDRFVLDVSESWTQEAFDVFLITLYTGFVTEKGFSKFEVQLFELSIIYQVKNLRRFCFKQLRKYLLNLSTVEELLKIVHRQKENTELISEFAEFLAVQ